MPKISVTFGRLSFVLEASEAEFAHLLETQRQQLAAKRIPLQSVPAVTAPHLGKCDPTIQRGMEVVLTAWALSQSAHHPGVPGRVIDFLPTHNFSLTITTANPSQFLVKIVAQARDDFAGEA